MRITGWAAAAIAAGAVILAGAGVFAAAVPASAGGGPTAFLADVADHLGIQPGALQKAVAQADADRVQALEQAGRISAAQAQRAMSRIQAGHVSWLGPRAPASRPLAVLARRSLVAEAAAYLGVPPRQVQADLRAGQSLGQVAGTVAGKSGAGLQSAILQAVEHRLATRVAAGRLTAAREQALLLRVSAALPRLMTRTWNGASRSPSGAPASGTASGTTSGGAV